MVLVLALIATVFLIAVWQWGTRWTLPNAGIGESPYRLAAVWDGSHVPGGGFDRPIGIAVASSGDVFVTDARQRVVHLSADGTFAGQWGSEGAGPGQFAKPVGVTVAPDGSVFVADYFQDRVQKFTSDSRFVMEFGTSGTASGHLRSPAGLAVDDRGHIYVADFYNHRVQEFHPNGSLVRIIGHRGRLGPGALHYPTGVTLAAGQLLVADAYNYQLQWFTADGQPLRRRGYHVLWLWPTPLSSNWPVPSASRSGFRVPTGVAVDPSSGVIHVADSGNHRVVMLSWTGAYLGAWSIPQPDPNVYAPEQVALSPDGRTLYATDLAANRVLVLTVNE